jgi:hypothetical protein
VVIVVVLTDSGDLVEVDLPGQAVTRTIAVGTGGSQWSHRRQRRHVGRFDTAGWGEHRGRRCRTGEGGIGRTDQRATAEDALGPSSRAAKSS